MKLSVEEIEKLIENEIATFNRAKNLSFEEYQTLHIDRPNISNTEYALSKIRSEAMEVELIRLKNLIKLGIRYDK